ncbi:MAG: patatin [Deltaproteobacteria bacterium]|nr:patatin [Deltaproteobacteria bacterium]
MTCLFIHGRPYGVDGAAAAAPRIAVVLSGGGARGAYEAGVLSYVLDELPAALGRPVQFSIVTGTSIGALHACYLAATRGAPGSGARLLQLWAELSLAKVYRIGAGDIARLPLWLLGRSRGPGLLDLGPGAVRVPGLIDTGPLEELIASYVDWARIEGNIAAGTPQALAVTATEIATGRSVVFVDTADGEIRGWPEDPFVVARPARIGANHALASAAIPVLFAARKVDGAFFCDGGLRLNTPLSPALHLGADRVLVIGLRHLRSAQEEDRIARERELVFLNPAYLAGKVLNALLLDRVESDVEQLRFANELLRAGEAECGDDFLRRAEKRIGRPLKIVESCLVRPSEDLGELAGECLRRRPRDRSATDRIAALFMRTVARGTGPDKDLLSYVLFDAVYAERLLALGRRDAAAAHDSLVKLFS